MGSLAKNEWVRSLIRYYRLHINRKKTGFGRTGGQAVPPPLLALLNLKLKATRKESHPSYKQLGQWTNLDMMKRLSQNQVKQLHNSKRTTSGRELKDITFRDLTLCIYIGYIQLESKTKYKSINGQRVSPENDEVKRMMFKLSLANKAYFINKKNLLEGGIFKLNKSTNLLQPSYYIAIDPERRQVIVGFCGTKTIYNILTDIAASSETKVVSGFMTHFGITEEAAWFIDNELEALKNCMQSHKDYQLNLVAHSLGGGIAALVAIMIQDKKKEELGFNPKDVRAIGFGTPPCVSNVHIPRCFEYE